MQDDEPNVGHNSTVGGIAADRLRSFVERIEAGEVERKEVTTHIKEIYLEVKSAGLDVKIIRQIIRIRAADPTVQQEQEELLHLYRTAIGC